MPRTRHKATKLTPMEARNIKPPPGKSSIEIWDAAAPMILRVTRSTVNENEFSRKLYRVVKDGKKTKKVPLGKFWYDAQLPEKNRTKGPGDHTLSEARKLCGIEIPDENSGQQASEISYKNKLLLEAVEDYLKPGLLKSRTLESYSPYKNLIENDDWLKVITLGEITKKVARMIIDKKLKPDGKTITTPDAAKKLAYLCSCAYTKAIEMEEEAIGNPFFAIIDTKTFRRETKHPTESGRALDDDEIIRMWHQLNKANGPGTPNTARALMLMLVTGLRSTEVTGMHSKEIQKPDLHGDVWWKLPPERIKTEHADKPVTEPHYIYLTPLMKRIIGNRNGFIFPNSKDPNRPMDRKAATHFLCRERGADDGTKSKYLGLDEKWTAQSMRVTVETRLRAWHIKPAYFNAMLNHAKTSLQKPYDKNTYADGKKETWLRWSEEIERIIGESQALNIRHVDPPRHDIELLRELVSSGETNISIAKQFGVSETRIRMLRKEHAISASTRN